MAKNLLSIAGYDPSGGAGTALDIRVFRHLGFHGFGLLTAVTAQNASHVTRTFSLPSGLVRDQYKALAEEVLFGGIKIGMLGSRENAAEAARIIAGNPSVPRVIDPVFRSSSGAELLQNSAIAQYFGLFKGKASLLTPNLLEASVLAKRSLRTVHAMKEAAKRIFDGSHIPCLVKGGHLKGRAFDILYDGHHISAFDHARVQKNVHGTGCFLSAAILGYLAEGRPLEEACHRGISLTARSIRKAVPAGKNRLVFSFPR